MPLPTPLVTIDPERLGGTPVFTGTRVPIKTLFDFIEDGATLREFLTSFPNVAREHAVAVLELAKDSLLGKAVTAAAE